MEPVVSPLPPPTHHQWAAARPTTHPADTTWLQPHSNSAPRRTGCAARGYCWHWSPPPLLPFPPPSSASSCVGILLARCGSCCNTIAVSATVTTVPMVWGNIAILQNGVRTYVLIMLCHNFPIGKGHTFSALRATCVLGGYTAPS